MKIESMRKSVSVLAVALAFTAIPSAASAARVTQLKDSFDPPNSHWSFDGQGSNSTSGLFQNPSLAHTGAWGAYLWTTGNEWQSVGRNVGITGWTSANRGTCSTSFWVISSGSDWYVSVIVEIINPVNWTYVKYQRDNVAQGWGWQQVTVRDWVPPRSNVFVRISAGGAIDNSNTYKQEMFAFVDDMTTSCYFP